MKTYSCFDEPLQVSGVPFFEKNKRLERVPAELSEKIKLLGILAKRCPGARVAFRTDAQSFTVKVTLKTLNVDVGMSIYDCQSVSVMIGDRQNARFAGLVNPPNYRTLTFEKSFAKSGKMEEGTLWLLRNEEIENIEVTFPDDARVEKPTPYKYGKALYYGSSITEGGCCCNVTNAYNAILCRRLDLDYYNFGFSGSAKGEIDMADYINTIDMKLFVYDYDHNAPDAEFLKRTHEPFFRRIREQHPDLPVLMMSRPDFDYADDAADRRAVIEETYNNAVKAGDKNVYYIDGETFFGKEERHLCTVDTIHPNDFGFHRMADVMEPVIRKILNIR